MSLNFNKCIISSLKLTPLSDRNEAQNEETEEGHIDNEGSNDSLICGLRIANSKHYSANEIKESEKRGCKWLVGASNQNPDYRGGQLLNVVIVRTLPVVEGEPLIVAPVCSISSIPHVGIAAFRCLPANLSSMKIIKGPHVFFREELASLRPSNATISLVIGTSLTQSRSIQCI